MDHMAEYPTEYQGHECDPKLSVNISSEDLFDIACLCQASMAQDAPYDEKHYINQILNMVWAYLLKHYKDRR